MGKIRTIKPAYYAYTIYGTLMSSYTPSAHRSMGKHPKGLYAEQRSHVALPEGSREYSGYYHGNRVPPAPQTPFDTSYGVSLLPSHLLMSSPFLATPGMGSASPHRAGGSRSSHAQSSYHTPNFGSTQLRMPPPTEKRNFKHGSSYRHNSSVQQRAYEVVFHILPRSADGGGDEYMTRSLLFSNLNPDTHLHDFLTKFEKFDRVESVYLVDSQQQSVLVSFLTKEACLDFYNGVLQKLSEFKKELKSKELTLNFASLRDVKTGPTLQEIKIEVLRAGATRSLILEFQDKVDLALLSKSLGFIVNEGPRYVVEAIEIVNAGRSSKHFGPHYAIIHFISIAMALETVEYLKSQSNKLAGLIKFRYVNTTSASGKSEFQTLSSSQLNERALSNTSDSDISGGESVASLGSKLQQTSLGEQTLVVDPTQYGRPLVEERSEHLPHVTISKALNSKSSLNDLTSNTTSPQPQEVLVNDHEDSSSRGSMVSLKQANSHGPAYPPIPGYPFYMNMSKPLGQTLQQQYTTTAQVATAMGGGLGNRTVYIGNISPRSKTEDICNVVRGGILQSVKYIEAKHICFVTFIEAASAVQFFANSTIEPIVLHGNVLKVGWGHHSGNLPQSISLAVTIGASRNVYVSLPEHAFKDKFIKDPEYQEFKEKFQLPSKEQLYEDFSVFGDIELINFLEDGHCCWINFMNISNAIKLVEDANNPNNDSFHEKFGNRYKGLFIGYGKDRCGNVNKNLVANKNSKYFKKVKKASYNIRLRKQQKGASDAPTEVKDEAKELDKPIKADAFGISVGDTQNPVRDSDEEQKLEEDELLRLSDLNNTGGGLGISLASSTGEETNTPVSDESSKEESVSSESSDVDILVSAPGSADTSQLESKTAPRSPKQPRVFANVPEKSSAFSAIIPRVSSASLDAVPPLAPSTLSRQYTATSKHNSRRGSRFGTTEISSPRYNDIRSQDSKKPLHPRRRKSKAIPGSDVMAQYLAQLQHSTFMYAANILGVDDGETVFYDENGPTTDPLI